MYTCDSHVFMLARNCFLVTMPLFDVAVLFIRKEKLTYRYVLCRHIPKMHVSIIKLHVSIIKLHVDLNKMQRV